MKCPICNNEMQEGGLLVRDVNPGWVPMEEFQKKGLRLIYRRMRTIGKFNILLGETKVPNAFFCEHCNKIVGVFDITNSYN